MIKEKSAKKFEFHAETFYDAGFSGLCESVDEALNIIKTEFKLAPEDWIKRVHVSYCSSLSYPFFQITRKSPDFHFIDNEFYVERRADCLMNL